MENRKTLLVAGFLTLIAAGIGFAVRGGLLDIWSNKYGFTMTELGQITGGGLLGFGLVILAAGLLVDWIGYKPLMMIAFVCHIVSAILLFSATPVFNAAGKDAVYAILFWSAFIFAIGNGICEGVINPLTAALYPEQKTHYLNILHAGWPAGLVIGGLIVFLKGSIGWEILLATYLIPTAMYGFIVLKEKFPKTDAQSGNISYGGMFARLVGPFFIILLIAHACVGYVELGTDSWINKITSNILSSAILGTALFIYTSLLMTGLRFFAGPIVHRISSLGLLLASACIGACGLYLISIGDSVPFMFFAATVYALGKTFLWPTMLGVVGERFPQSATVAMALMGFVGMTSAGYLGGPGIGYKQDYYASQYIQENNPETFARVKAPNENKFLFFPAIVGIDGSKAGMLGDNGEAIESDVAIAGDAINEEGFKGLREQYQWWNENKANAEVDAPPVAEATLHGSRMAIRMTALVPATMAVLYLILMVAFKSPREEHGAASALGEPAPGAEL
ncbi:MFS transporter [Rubripirellula amarantea]|uniref:Major Facilitator Superfamily protein n=1 Tax=Rubripirellula amarantea TaxID=2527999 RepID=A0A5C5WWR4_9BACT|nr:MFS transporter [Rubripirellula amarantea]MDA8746231.1 MFS transporter [Rubripirellula amarantea]TWT54581.1 Major Facilitator Superfamily protein [Rubripirellula amarantea]